MFECALIFFMDSVELQRDKQDSRQHDGGEKSKGCPDIADEDPKVREHGSHFAADIGDGDHIGIRNCIGITFDGIDTLTAASGDRHDPMRDHLRIVAIGDHIMETIATRWSREHDTAYGDGRGHTARQDGIGLHSAKDWSIGRAREEDQHPCEHQEDDGNRTIDDDPAMSHGASLWTIVGSR